MSRFKHGQPVTLAGVDGTIRTGTLHLPDVVMYSRRGPESLPREATGYLGVYTIALPDGGLFRTEGRLL